MSPRVASRAAVAHDSVPASRAPALVLASVVLLLVLLYGRVFIKLVHDWYSIPDFSHGLLIPFFVAYLIWHRREQLRGLPLRPTWAGVPLVALGLAVLLVGIYGADLFLSRTSFVVLAFGLVLTFAGKQWTRLLTFPILVLLLGIPFPAVVFNQITFPLQLMASQVASSLLPVFGVPVLREGNVMQLASMKLEVAEACSGIRSLMSLFTIAVIYGSLVERSTAKRVVIALISIPIAVVANVARIVGTGLCVQYWDPEKALGFFHEFSGWLIFVVSLALLATVHSLLSFSGRRREVTA